MIFLLCKYVIFAHWIDAGQDTAYVVVLSSIAVTCLLWIAVALGTEPEEEEKLLAFYKDAQPMGWWGPIAEKAGVETGGAAPIVRGLGIALLGAVAIGGGVIGFSGLYVGRWEVALIGGGVALVLGLLFRGSYVRHMRALEADAVDAV